MKNRVVSFLMAAIIVFGLAAIPAKAVTPADPLIASAMYSFLVSAGIKLWRDGVEGSDTAISDLVDDMQTIWGLYRDNNSGVPTWARIAGITTQDGDIILEHDTAQTFQGFANWLAEYKQMIPGGTYNVLNDDSSGGSDNAYYNTLPADELQGLTLLNSGVWALPVSYGYSVVIDSGLNPESDNYYFSQFTVNGGNAVFLIIQYYNGSRNLYIASESQISVDRNTVYPNKEETELTVLNSNLGIARNVSRPNDGSNFRYYFVQTGINNSSIYNLPTNAVLQNGNLPVSEMCYVALAGDPVGTTEDLFATIGGTVVDRVRDLLDGQSLAIDVGASANADEEEIVGVVAGEYAVPATSEVLPSAVAYPLPIAGVQELYPQAQSAADVDDLGLPALGKALTTRFPFCIPWDVVYLYQSLNATPERPVIDIDLFPQSFKQRIGIVADTSFIFDLGDQRYELLLKIVRWSTLFGFVLGLAYVTKRLIWTTGG